MTHWLETIVLPEIRRQREAVDREVVRLAHEGRGSDALDVLAASEQLRIADTHEEALDALALDWHRSFGVGEDAVMIARRNEDVARLNEAAREIRRERGELGESLLVAGADFTIDSSNVSLVQTYISEHFPPSEFAVRYQPTKAEPEDREALYEPPVRAKDGRLFAGDAVSGQGDTAVDDCTLAFGALEYPSQPKPNGEYVPKRFALTAGHCFVLGASVYRYARKGSKNVEFAVGKVVRRPYNSGAIEGFMTDAEAIELSGSYSAPQWIWASPYYQSKPTSVAAPHIGEIICNSGINGGTSCEGVVTGFNEEPLEGSSYPELVWEVKGLHTEPGDSGGPVWDPQGPALGLWTGGHMFFTPLVGSTAEEGGSFIGNATGVLGALGMGNLSVVVAQ